MGYGAKAIMLQSVRWTMLMIFADALRAQGVVISGKTSPGMRTYDIWGAAPKNEPMNESEQNQVTSSDDVLLHDYSQKSSLRHGKVLNFFPVLNEDECKTEDGRRSGVCMNVYDCHRKGGTSKGQCALGFGACCVFTASCDQEVKNNITYIVSPSFPALMSSNIKSCKFKVKMMSPDISQLRFDFVHFSMGQPNRRTGDCDGDIFSLLGGSNGEFKFCGQNNGQHIYYDVPNGKARDGEATGVVDVVMNFTSSLAASRFWEIRISQIPFSQRAPAGCLQYFTGNEGVIQTFNFAENGRHLSNQNYRACVRQESGMCSIAYEPCNEQSFRIGPTQMPYTPSGLNMGGGLYSNPYQSPFNVYPQNGLYSPNGLNPLIASNGMIGPNGMLIGPNGLPQMIAGPPGMLNMLNPNAPGQVPGAVGVNSAGSGAGGGGGGGGGDPNGQQPNPGDQFSTPANATIANTTMTSNATQLTTTTTTLAPPQNDEVDGSGDGDGDDDDSDVGSLFSLGSLLTRAALFRSFSSHPPKRSPRQFYSTCKDRITMPCIVEDFISAGMGSVPSCSPVHCGNSLCSGGNVACRVESTVTPFGLGIHFGDGTFKGSPEDNIGACIRYSQLKCV